MAFTNKLGTTHSSGLMKIGVLLKRVKKYPGLLGVPVFCLSCLSVCLSMLLGFLIQVHSVGVSSMRQVLFFGCFFRSCLRRWHVQVRDHVLCQTPPCQNERSSPSRFCYIVVVIVSLISILIGLRCGYTGPKMRVVLQNVPFGLLQVVVSMEFDIES